MARAHRPRRADDLVARLAFENGEVRVLDQQALAHLRTRRKSEGAGALGASTARSPFADTACALGFDAIEQTGRGLAQVLMELTDIHGLVAVLLQPDLVGVGRRREQRHGDRQQAVGAEFGDVFLPVGGNTGLA